MGNTIDLAALPEADRKAFYGALFSIAAVDGTIDKEEMHLIYESLNVDGMSVQTQKEVYGYIIEPPILADSLERLAQAEETLRFGVMLNLIDVARADDVLTSDEQNAITFAQQKLGIMSEQVAAIEAFVKETKRIRERGLDDDYAADAIKRAAAGLSSVGIPLAAVYFSGSVVGLSAAGITSGLAALGLGGVLGLSAMVTGIGIAVVVGAGLYMGVSKLLDAGGGRKKERHRSEQDRKARLVIQNLQATMNTLVQQINTLMADSGANREAILVLNARLTKLRGLLESRKQLLESASA